NDARELQVTEEPVFADALVVVRQPRDHGHDQREGHPAVGRQAESRQHLEQVSQQDEEEQRRQERNEPVRVVAEHRYRDLLSDEREPVLEQRLELAWYHGWCAEREEEE